MTNGYERCDDNSMDLLLASAFKAGVSDGVEVSAFTLIDYLDAIKGIVEYVKGYQVPDIKHVMSKYPNKLKACFIALPFDNGFFTPQFMDLPVKNLFFKEGRFMRILLINEHLYDGVNPVSSAFNVLPDDIKRDISEGGCVFEIDYPDNQDPEVWFKSQLEKAYQNLLALIMNG